MAIKKIQIVNHAGKNKPCVIGFSDRGSMEFFGCTSTVGGAKRKAEQLCKKMGVEDYEVLV